MPDTIIIRTEDFKTKGGWCTDTQSFGSLGSAYLLAHGLGKPVADAAASVRMETGGRWHLWVKTRDWTATWGRNEAPGRFQVALNNIILKNDFGNEGKDWHWQYGAEVELLSGENTITLHDLTGFDGRCAGIALTKEMSEPVEGFPDKETEFAGHYDLVVAGGGIAGCCTAISAARLGCKVALIHNRPVLGGNNSSEVRVGLSGLIFQEPYPRLGLLMDEIGGIGHWTAYEAHQDPSSERSKHILDVLEKHPEKMIHNAGPASNYQDGLKLDVVRASGVDIFLNCQLNGVRNSEGRITGVSAFNISDGMTLDFTADLFADCTGDADLGYLCGADWTDGREAKSQTLEPRAPLEADHMTMGTSVQWYSAESDTDESFPDCPWALKFNDSNCLREKRGDWQWEAGIGRDQIGESEYIRDYALRAVFGNWAFLKNHSQARDDFRKSRLEWVAHIGGKRESRRLLGDVILKEQDILDRTVFDDASFTTTWPVDLHFPITVGDMEGEPFMADCDNPPISPYPVPYRCLYSRNIDNLLMAGRNISVTHIALGTVRVMRTCGMMGEVAGMAASICRKYNASPRDVYKNHLDELRELMKKGVPSELL